jgi:hypothetical protein
MEQPRILLPRVSPLLTGTKRLADAAQNYACAVGQITFRSPPVSRPIRGAYRDRHERWTRDAVDTDRQLTSDDAVDGEVVWS